MRLDKFLKVTMLIKRRSVANEAADEGFIYVNGRKAKASTKIKVGDKILLDMWNYKKEVFVKALPETKGGIPKKDVDKYIEVLSYEPKHTDDFI
ncbi:RNA-binding S4 protein [Deferribacter desulfuricans SSM1]|uniref:RNA-binding S4 protein n=1 Tax=Deferribacter desulfuricans (strain DSM 14783 / JCM 11476 / NBRC 101012 / SSM1) TaxID=639282 RepID=D3PAX0_DEFDS|nr:S4 domain-containing protein [Deferribacter desulfuricans]BAI79743.1 RNA-binding S4 protein [Deferribacter desulfuricans SSM1]